MDVWTWQGKLTKLPAAVCSVHSVEQCRVLKGRIWTGKCGRERFTALVSLGATPCSISRRRPSGQGCIASENVTGYLKSDNIGVGRIKNSIPLWSLYKYTIIAAKTLF